MTGTITKAATTTLMLLSGVPSDASAARLRVALDCYHNNEGSPHYQWKRSGVGGYADFAQVVLGQGADTLSIRKPLDASSLGAADILIISDPDTPAEAKDPKYISDAEADAVDAWVESGGLLMLMANDAGNCEFMHLNVLAGKFGIHFNEDLVPGPRFAPLPAHPFFTGCTAIFMRDVSSLTLSAPAEPVLSLDGKTLIATARKGKGAVIALGDPWVYDEHIDDENNKTSINNVMKWLMAGPASLGRPALSGLPADASRLRYRADGRLPPRAPASARLPAVLLFSQSQP
jgi:unsaturated rhamnogalacturonyl hydrolase